MKRKIMIEIDLTSQSGEPTQIEYQVDEIEAGIRRQIEYERFNEDNRIVYNDWEDPHVCELSISMEVLKDE